MGPAALEAAALSLARDYGAQAHVIAGEALLEANFPLIHAVGRAAKEPPRLVDITWGDANARKVTLVGKGVCFDTGGLDIKPSSAMLLMKKDMAGAAAALALARMIMDAKLPVRLRVLLPIVENAIAGDAFPARRRLPQPQGLSRRDRQHGRRRPPDSRRRIGAGRRGGARASVRFRDADRRGARGARPRARALLHDGRRARRGHRASRRRRPPIPFGACRSGTITTSCSTASRPISATCRADHSRARSRPRLFLRRFVEKTTSWTHFDIYGWNPSARPGTARRRRGADGAAALRPHRSAREGLKRWRRRSTGASRPHGPISPPTICAA